MTSAPRSDRDTLLAVVSGVAVGLLALSFPSPVAFLGLIPAVIASLDLLRRGQQTAVGVMLLSAAFAAGLPSGWMLFGGSRAAARSGTTPATSTFRSWSGRRTRSWQRIRRSGGCRASTVSSWRRWQPLSGRWASRPS